jgi:deazaflavin-dependent oxidoreductase (nitroreductase family)
MPSDVKPEQFLYLTTTGRRTGQPRTIEIWFTEFQGCHYCIAEHETAKWVANIRANPAVRWRVGEQELAGTARVLDPKHDTYACMMVQQLSRSKYGWGEGTVVELKPDTAGGLTPSHGSVAG